ncbi:hypothetical protein ACFXA8_37130, partial [Streptomyces sp. NPDC059409]
GGARRRPAPRPAGGGGPPPPDPAPPPGVAEGTLFPHVFGPVDRAAVRRVLEVHWDDGGRATGLR